MSLYFREVTKATYVDPARDGISDGRDLLRNGGANRANIVRAKLGLLFVTDINDVGLVLGLDQVVFGTFA